MRLTWQGQLVVVLAAALGLTLTPHVPQLWADLSGPSFPEALLAAGSLLTLVLAGWVLLISALVTLGVSAHILRRVTPRLLRGVLLAGAVGAVAIGPVHAGQIAGGEGPLPHSVTGLPLPDRPEARTVSAPASTSSDVTVRPGDSLWAIASRSLPFGATNAQIASASRAWHRVNRDTIGPDPHLIFPAQRLTPPTGKDLP